MDKGDLPQYSPVDQLVHHRQRRHNRRRFIRLIVITCFVYAIYSQYIRSSTRDHPSKPQLLSLNRLQDDHAKCSQLRTVPKDPSGYRERNARYVEGQRSILIRNATVWTGEPVFEVTPEEARAGRGFEWIPADILMERGLITQVLSAIPEQLLPADYETLDAQGRQVTAGIVDMHSHTGVDSLPELRGVDDTNELSNDITPYVRSIDGFNPLDHQIQVIKSGGVSIAVDAVSCCLDLHSDPLLLT